MFFYVALTDVHGQTTTLKTPLQGEALAVALNEVRDLLDLGWKVGSSLDHGSPAIGGRQIIYVKRDQIVILTTWHDPK